MTQSLQAGTLTSEAVDVDRWLREGHPSLGWRGDPRLSLEIGVVTATRFGYDERARRVLRPGDVVALSFEVHRHCEDGTDQRLLQRSLNKLHEIIPQLIKMDPRTPGFEPVMDTVEREDAIVQKAKADAIGQARAEHAEHLWKLVADRENGKTTFRGLPGLNPDKQL